MTTQADRRTQAEAWLAEDPPRTLAWIGRQWGVSRERARQLLVGWGLWAGRRQARHQRFTQLYQQWAAGTRPKLPRTFWAWADGQGLPRERPSASPVESTTP